jgi:hypothetical protein
VSEKETREAKFYSCAEDSETLTCATVREAIEQFLDECHEDPETVTVYGFAPMLVDKKLFAAKALDYLLEWLEDEFGDPDRISSCEATEAMKTSALALVETVLSEFEVWACEKVAEQTINLSEWRAKQNNQGGQ